MNFDERSLVQSIFQPPHKANSLKLEDIYSNSKTFVAYSLARHALCEGLKALGLKEGESVLVPSFICRDVLAPFNKLGLNILFYPVNENLKISAALEELPPAKAIFAIHFFGLETDLEFFKAYCEKHRAFLLEDNAHGFLSRNKKGELLGAMGDIGIISVRKSLPIENGALLLSTRKLDLLVPQVNDFQSIRLEIKNKLRPLVARVGVRVLLAATAIKRQLRKIIKGEALPLSGDDDEFEIPLSLNPIDLQRYFEGMDFESECARRRKLFQLMQQILATLPVRPLRKNLSEREVPYGFPFFCDDEKIDFVRKQLNNRGLEIVHWPALPKAIVEKGFPVFYRQLYLVKFLW